MKKTVIIMHLFMLLTLFIMLAVGCEMVTPSQDKSQENVDSLIPGFKGKPGESSLENNEKNEGVNSQQGEELDVSRNLTREELSLFQPNELGEVMILMYHRIGYPESEWTRTPENFQRDLEELYSQGYRTVSLLDYVRGEIDIPLGTSPVILTFDDGTQGQFNYIEGDNGPIIDPECAVGILEDFYLENPDFGRAATFYIYYPLPFRQSEYIEDKLEYLRENGYDIGNHSYTHANLSKISSEEVEKELAQHARKTQEILPGYQVRSLALPFGIFPQDNDLVKQGEYEGFNFENEAVLLVGYRPAPSPFSIALDPYRLPRIRASETKVEEVGLYDWLSYFETYPDRRYVSDGSTSTLTAPEDQRHKLSPEVVGEREVIFYAVDEEDLSEET
ncbi:polysaccharide deacetylase family protein [Candidatus Contubernalis alkaliaceticus]|uniref:polysaccharide deacetylase family protein n=1 Tax=Candidatus Contubernalis alkaliaceticus TaxID=338645 RepID=UPI001F4BD59D|nr:polysaccharide deacetylase family protein [Candidatus Contubernalis alkalaceticus]UNC91614.1 polysaccharide deacetylase family protein [Candidatus Contubernalis alkalaceticus]